VSEAGYDSANNKSGPANTPANNADTNEGLTQRLTYINLDHAGVSFSDVANSLVSNLISKDEIQKLYLSNISKTSAEVVEVSSPLVQYSVKATIMLKDIHPLFEVMPVSKSLNFKIQIYWNNSAFTATHTATVGAVAGVWSSQSAQYSAYNETIPLMLNNFVSGFGTSTAGTIRTSIYVGDTCHDSIKKTITATGLITGSVE
jgi:hypothetical protein